MSIEFPAYEYFKEGFTEFCIYIYYSPNGKDVNLLAYFPLFLRLRGMTCTYEWWIIMASSDAFTKANLTEHNF